MNYLKTFGCYPPEYNRKVHGSYYPFRNYGPKDTPLGDVKLVELKSWIAKKPKSPFTFINFLSRSAHLYIHKWARPFNSNSSFLFHFIIFTNFLFYMGSYKFKKEHAIRKHH